MKCVPGEGTVPEKRHPPPPLLPFPSGLFRLTIYDDKSATSVSRTLPAPPPRAQWGTRETGWHTLSSSIRRRMLADPFNHPAGYSPSSKVGDRWRWSLTYTPFLERERDFWNLSWNNFSFRLRIQCEFQTLSLYVRNLKIHEASKSTIPYPSFWKLSIYGRRNLNYNFVNFYYY